MCFHPDVHGLACCCMNALVHGCQRHHHFLRSICAILHRHNACVVSLRWEIEGFYGDLYHNFFVFVCRCCYLLLPLMRGDCDAEACKGGQKAHAHSTLFMPHTRMSMLMFLDCALVEKAKQSFTLKSKCK